MKNILVPTDFSDCAKVAEEIGFEIAKKANAEIHFLHLLATPTDWVKLSLEKEELYPETKAKIGTAKNELNELKKRAEKAGIISKEFLVFDKGKVEILDHIEHHQHDFIIMGSHGAHGAKEILGSNTQKVIRNAKVPVLVLKDEPAKFEVSNIVFASTFQEDVHLSFEKVIAFAELIDAQIHLLNVNMPFNFQESDEAEANMQAFRDKCPRDNCTINIYNALNEERGIQKFADKIKADVIAMTTHGRSGFMKMLSPSITESLVNHSSFPILSVNIHVK